MRKFAVSPAPLSAMKRMRSPFCCTSWQLRVNSRSPAFNVRQKWPLLQVQAPLTVLPKARPLMVLDGITVTLH
jgi:hypothetical protein